MPSCSRTLPAGRERERASFQTSTCTENESLVGIDNAQELSFYSGWLLWMKCVFMNTT